jgi:hypothetical protein
VRSCLGEKTVLLVHLGEDLARGEVVGPGGAAGARGGVTGEGEAEGD